MQKVSSITLWAGRASDSAASFSLVPMKNFPPGTSTMSAGQLVSRWAGGAAESDITGGVAGLEGGGGGPGFGGVGYGVGGPIIGCGGGGTAGATGAALPADWAVGG